ncbi:hypothetical protein Tco_0917697 [Tanacetum coccineum]
MTSFTLTAFPTLRTDSVWYGFTGLLVWSGFTGCFFSSSSRVCPFGSRPWSLLFGSLHGFTVCFASTVFPICESMWLQLLSDSTSSGCSGNEGLYCLAFSQCLMKWTAQVEGKVK